MRRRGRGDEAGTELAEALPGAARPLRGAEDLDPLLDRIGDARIVMLGEASHGTSEFYTWRTRITRRLVEEKGFSFLAVEGDWPDCERVDRAVKRPGDVPPREALEAFRRWPTWMWANWEVVALAEWMARANAQRPPGRRVGFYGLDVYGLWASLHSVMDYLERTDPDALPAARRAFSCFEPYGEEAQAYARATAFVPTSCEEEVVELLGEMRRRAAGAADGREDAFSAEQNARAVAGAERYYRAMVRGGSESWNVRDEHMIDTLDALLDHHGPDGKAIVWAHDTHVGDARATDMADAGMVNLGGLARDRHGRDDVVLVGFGTHRGEVIAGDAWGAPMERMRVPRGREGSWEDLLHRAVGHDALVLTEDLPEAARARRGHRAIGVVYDPQLEAFGNYVPTVLPDRYDAFVHLEATGAVHPLHLEPTDAGPPETYPWGV